MKTPLVPHVPYFLSDVQVEDRNWFDLRPARTCRLRGIRASEFEDFGIGTHVVVKRISTWDRARSPVTLLGIPRGLKELLEGDNQLAPELDSVLSEFFEAAQTGRSIELGRVIRAALKRSRASK